MSDEAVIQAFFGAVRRDLILYAGALGVLAAAALAIAIAGRDRFVIGAAAGLLLGALALGGAALNYVSGLDGRDAQRCDKAGPRQSTSTIGCSPA